MNGKVPPCPDQTDSGRDPDGHVRKRRFQTCGQTAAGMTCVIVTFIGLGGFVGFGRVPGWHDNGQAPVAGKHHIAVHP
jgi:hypothetical protein